MQFRILLVVAMVLSACSGDSSTANDTSTTEAPPSSEAEPETTTTATPSTTTTTAAPSTTTTIAATDPEGFEYVGRGAFDVGVATVMIDEDTDRALTVDVWFPLTPGTTGDPQEYTLLPGVFYESPGAIAAEFESTAEGEFPLVVYSHGSGGQRWLHSNYTETIASHGYVVVAPDHTGNTLLERFSDADIDFDEVAFNRVNDVRSLIDAATGADETEPLGEFLNGRITDDLVVTGHSFGGFTTYALVSGAETEAGALAPDDRVDAVITLAPATNGLTDDLLAAVDVPHLVMVGDSDDTTPVDPNVERPWEFVSGSPSYRVELVAAEHQSFTDLCNYQRVLPEQENVPEFIVDVITSFAATDCVDTAMDIDRVQEITNGFVIRFLEEVFRDGAPLAEADVTDNDVRFFHK